MNKENLKLNWALPLPKSVGGKQHFTFINMAYQFSLLMKELEDMRKSRKYIRMKVVRDNPSNFIMESVSKSYLSNTSTHPQIQANI